MKEVSMILGDGNILFLKLNAGYMDVFTLWNSVKLHTMIFTRFCMYVIMPQKNLQK